MSVRERTFQARDMLWTMFEQMAHDQAVPVDNLVNEAMKAYATARGYTPARLSETPERSDRRRVDPLEETRDRPSASAPVDAYADDELGQTQARRMDRGMLAREPGPHTPSGVGRPPGPPMRISAAPAPSRPVRPAAGMPPLGMPPSRAPAEPTLRSRPPPLPPPPLAPPMTQRIPGSPSGASHAAHASMSARRLVLTYRGRPTTVDKDRFLIGRSKTQADLRLDDPNVSRQHVAIERVGTAWYVVDLGSTNGVFVSGERVTRRALVDGDVIVITTHEIRCSLA